MSATLGNVDAIADKLSDLNDTPDVDVIADAPRPVPLSYEYTLDPMEKTVELAFRNGETPIYVVHFSQDAALETAQALASTGVSSKEQRQAIAEAIKGVKFTTPSARFCSDCCAPVSASITPACCLATAAWSNSSPSRVCAR